MIKLEVKADGTLAALKGLSKKASNLQAPLGEAGQYMEAETKLNYARESGPDGERWASLAPSTVQRKGSSAILRETGEQAAAVTMEGPSSSEVRVVNKAAHSIWSQLGTSRQPQRKHIGISEGRHVPKIERIFSKYLEF